MNDEHLIARSISGDDSAFSQLVRNHQSALRQFLRRITAGDHALADDIAQDSFILAFQKLAQFRGQGSFAAWLRKLAYHRFLRVVETGAQKYEQPCDVSWQSLETRDAVEADILAEKLMAMLSVPERLTITLNCSEGLSHTEIAEITGLPLGTIKSHIAKAKRRLNDFIQAEAVA
ncbi:RNA polymerase sigma factor [Pleionea litopenaei]|uniref:Sigma-70 family RNA polymerase sigma factor n=1 Tax=Pleionea litopenaei TaxID=3070815 RepID=A0AA51X6M2_9GAMM|nr:sigma-70 family RNA polymerase sigma factor [Pleionea sp. HL-JVS1]WMS86981.1 sigma-70 family RNA polymerase sigma factor [Pleionea sp. HL-JVS1]